MVKLNGKDRMLPFKECGLFELSVTLIQSFGILLDTLGLISIFVVVTSCSSYCTSLFTVFIDENSQIEV